MATEAEVKQAILDTQGRRAAWNRTMDDLWADANAYSVQKRGRPLPQPNAYGQLPPSGVVITQQVEPPTPEHERGG